MKHGLRTCSVGLFLYAFAAAAQVLSTSTYTYVPLPSDTYVVPKAIESDTPILVTPAFMMQAGEMRRVIGQLDFRMPGGHDNPEVGNGINCFDQAGQLIADHSNGTNYTGSGHAYQWNNSLLLVAPATGNYVCQLYTYASGNPGGGWRMTVLAPAKGQTTYGTWLQFSSAPEIGAQAWSFELGLHGCLSSGQSGCTYIGGPARSNNPTFIDVFSGDVFAASSDATTIDGIVAAQITTCTSGTSSCPSQEHGDSGVHDGKGVSWLDLDQLYQDGKTVCRTNRVYSEVPGRQILLSESYNISDAQHHRPMYYHLSAPVSQLCGGSRQFAVDLHIQWTGGNGVKIEGAVTNVIDSVRSTTTNVPPVIGLTQAQAAAAITEVGLYMPAPNNLTGTAPAGTVLAQNSPGGTVEPIGSPVQVTVSLGQTTVPAVVGDLSETAVQAIKSAGLEVVWAPPYNDCADQKKVGTVRSESPGAHAVVSPGSQVSLQLIACNR